MAAEASFPSSKTEKLKKKKKLRAKPDNEALDSLPWNDSLRNEDPFSLLVGDDEGGFLSLEEIDESEYSLLPGITGSGEVVPSVLAKSKKRKRGDVGGASGHDSCIVRAGSENERSEHGGGKKKQNKKKKKKKAKSSKNKSSDSAEEKITNGGPIDTSGASVYRVEDNGVGASGEESILDEYEFYAWKELRLHPLLMKSIYRLGFREPTPIQKACIPLAAHQGKDVIGAAETGSGKTLAFGLPILQRFLEEQEKAARLLVDDGNVPNRGIQESPLRALIVTPTRELALQVSDHLKEAAKLANIYVVPIVGGISTEKQERLLKRRPQIIVGTPGRLWELMSGGDRHLTELHSLSFFVLDEADRMIESGHFHELQSIIDMLPNTTVSTEGHQQTSQACGTVSRRPKKRQTFVFSATIALSASFRKKLKHGSLKPKESVNDHVSSIETLSQRAGMRADVAIVDLTNAAILADKLEESFIECKEEDKDAYTYYILSMHGRGRTIVFCTSIAALRHISSLLRILGIDVWTLHAQMQQRARLKAIDRFRGNEHGVLVATDVAARGLDIPGVRTVIHYQLPHSAEVYVHRSGRTARASADGCCIAIISPNDRSKFAFLCKSFSKETLKRFPVDDLYMTEVFKRLSLARQIDNISRGNSQEKAKKSWLERNAESAELVLDDSGSEEERVKGYKQKKIRTLQLKKLLEELNKQLARPLQPKTFSHRYLAGAGISTLLQRQLEELGRQKLVDSNSSSEGNERQKLVVIGRDCIEPLQALQTAGHEACMNLKLEAEKHKMRENIKRERREHKKRLREERRKEKKRKKEGSG